MEEKVKIIDEIVKRHPHYGVDIGWSYYVGGMADTGDWYFRKMLDEPLHKLKSFLDQLTFEENRPVVKSNKTQKELMAEFKNEIERKLMFGK